MKQMMIVLALGMTAAGCFHVKVDPVEVKPITLNVNLAVDRQLDDFFAYQKAGGGAATTAASTQPAAAAK